MTFSKKLLSTSVLFALSSSAFSALEGNYGVTSDYIWRGTSLSNHGPAVFGGVDYSNDSGFYAGIWNSSEGAVGETNETDLYAGYTFKVGSIDLDIGLIAYNYFSEPDSDFNEVYLSAGFGIASASVFVDSENENTYFNLGTELAGFGIELGLVDLNSENSDYNHIGISYNLNEDVSISLYSASGDGAATNPSGLFITYSKSFDI